MMVYHILLARLGPEQGGPRKVYQLEVVLAVLEALTAVLCAFLRSAPCLVSDFQYFQRPGLLLWWRG